MEWKLAVGVLVFFVVSLKAFHFAVTAGRIRVCNLCSGSVFSDTDEFHSSGQCCRFVDEENARYAD